MKIGKFLTLAALGGLTATAVFAQAGKTLYENNFEKAAMDSIPEDFLVLDGGFKVKEADGGKVVELPGDPLETYGFLFGPTEKENLAVTARIHGTGKGRRFPFFGVGLSGVGGYRLMVAPAKQAIEIYKGDNVVATVPNKWASDTWTQFRLEVRKAGTAWKVEGKVWKQGDAEPKEPTISYDEKEEPIGGRPTVWGSPFAGTPIKFDDLKVVSVSGK
ncbi:MAG: hypothetical protein ACO1QS_19925 [Verrucomicrobiota bacterium]